MAVQFVAQNYRPLDATGLRSRLEKIQLSSKYFNSTVKVAEIFSGDGTIGDWITKQGAQYIGLEHSDVVRMYAEFTKPLLDFRPLSQEAIIEALSADIDLVLILFRKADWAVDEAAAIIETVLRQPIGRIILSLPYPPEIFKIRQWDFFKFVDSSLFNIKSLGCDSESSDSFFCLTKRTADG